MSVISSTYYEALPNLDRYGNLDDEEQIHVHVGSTFYEHVHLSIESYDQITEVNMSIENAMAIVAGLTEAIESGKKGRALRNG